MMSKLPIALVCTIFAVTNKSNIQKYEEQTLPFQHRITDLHLMLSFTPSPRIQPATILQQRGTVQQRHPLALPRPPRHHLDRLVRRTEHLRRQQPVHVQPRQLLQSDTVRQHDQPHHGSRKRYSVDSDQLRTRPDRSQTADLPKLRRLQGQELHGKKQQQRPLYRERRRISLLHPARATCFPETGRPARLVRPHTFRRHRRRQRLVDIHLR